MQKAKQDSANAKAEDKVKDVNLKVDAETLEAKQDSANAKAEESDAQNIVHVSVSVELALEQLSTIEGEFVKVLINYPEDWNKSKFFIDGETKEVHKANAEIFIKQGIATLVTE